MAPSIEYEFGFTSTTAVQIAAHITATAAIAEVEAFLQSKISGSSLMVSVGSPSMSFEPGWTLLPLVFRTRKSYSLTEAHDAAAAAIAHLILGFSELTTIAGVRADDTPAIASCGMMLKETF